MADWRINAINDLREYEAVRASLTALPAQIKELDGRMSSIRSAGADSVPVQGGTSAREDALINAIDRKERLRINYGVAKRKTERIERGINGLSDNERRVLELFYIRRCDGYIGRLCGELAMERAQIYRIKDIALKRFTLSMYGVVDL